MPSFRYPPGAFSTGRLDGVPVPCLSGQQQLRFRQGYAHRDEDRHDLVQLARLPSPTWTNGCP